MRNFSFFKTGGSNKSSNINIHLKPGSGSLVQRARLASGLVLMVFVVFHFINHALGNISIEAMLWMQEWRQVIWRSVPGTVLLYGAFVVHIVLVVWKQIARKTLKIPAWEWVQILLGIAIPFFLVTHIIAQRASVELLGVDIDYRLALMMMWPGAALVQSFLLLVVWFHGCLGIHYWLKLRPWYNANIRWFAFAATLLPTLALTGWINAARTNAANMAQLLVSNPEEAAVYFDTRSYIYGEILPLIMRGQTGVMVMGAIVVAIILAHQVVIYFRKRVKIDYGDGKIITTAPGSTILEVSRQAGIPHMSVCGGRARCSTCRSLILEGEENLAPPTEPEAKLLARLNAEPSIRLACQARVNGNIALRPLLQPQLQNVLPNSSDQLGWGVEKQIAILFLDIRGFSKISEKSLPYDVVFILNSFFGEVASAVEANNGYVDKFMGDGMMALFGLSTGKVEAARDAIRAAIDCEKAAGDVSRILTQHLDEPIKIGIGIHIGDAVIGRIGKTSDQEAPSRLTAIGDSVNVAARLEQATKEFATPLVISTDTASLAGLKNLEQFGTTTKIKVRNISRPVEILAVNNLPELAIALQ